MAAGSIIIDLLMRTGSFETDTKRAEKRLSDMERKFMSAGKAIGGAIAGFGIVAYVKDLLSGIDALNDLADATGASIENLSALEDIAARTGTNFDAMGGAVIKFNQQLKNTDPESNAGRALEMLGLKMSDLQKMDPAEALHKTALALAEWADEGNKARLVQELFGKSTKEVGAFLKDLADQSQLVATVTTEEAKQAEAFNQQLSQMAKNSKDLARSIAGDLLPELNALLKAWREGGTLGALFGVGGMDDPGKKLTEINDKLTEMKRLRADLDPSKSMANKVNEFIFGDVGDLDKQISALEKEQKFLKSLQQTRALTGLGDTSDALSRRLGSRPTIAALTPKDKKEKAAKDPDADFKSYLDNLEKQIQKTHELNAEEKLLDDIRRGQLTVSPKQEAMLTGLARQIDMEKDAMATATTRAEQRKKDYDAAVAGAREIEEADRAWLHQLTDDTPTRKMEEMIRSFARLDKALDEGLDPQVYAEARNRLAGLTDDTTKAKSTAEELGTTFTSSLEQAAVAGADLSDVLKGLLQDLLRIFFRLQVTEPLMESFKRAGSGPSGGGGSSFWGSLITGVIGAFTGGSGVTPPNPYAGARAGGGDVLPGRRYRVGERGPEDFVPRTAGTVVPNGGMAGLTLINQTTGRVDRVVEQSVSPTQRALILQENRAAIIGELYDPNSKLSQAMSKNFTTSRRRA